MVVRAVKTIGPGDLINENYGPIFTQKKRADRQKLLKERYWFDCRCQPCVEEWPLISEMTEEALRFRCSGCRKPLVVPADTMTPFITCYVCKKSNNILKVKPTCRKCTASTKRAIFWINAWPCLQTDKQRPTKRTLRPVQFWTNLMWYSRLSQ